MTLDRLLLGALIASLSFAMAVVASALIEAWLEDRRRK